MSEQSTEAQAHAPRPALGSATVYSARVQEVMRYDKLRSAEYPIVMTILDAVLRGYSEEKWKEVQQRQLKTLSNQSPDKKAAYPDEANRYEQMVCNLKDLQLWPW